MLDVCREIGGSLWRWGMNVRCLLVERLGAVCGMLNSQKIKTHRRIGSTAILFPVYQ